MPWVIAANVAFASRQRQIPYARSVGLKRPAGQTRLAETAPVGNAARPATNRTIMDSATGRADRAGDLDPELRFVLAAIPETIVVIDRGGRFRRDFTGDPDLMVAPQVVGKTLDEFYSVDTAARMRDVIARTLAEKATQQLTYAVSRPQGTRWFSARVVPYGSVDDPCVLWVARDTTERNQAEAALRAAESRLAEAQRISGIGSWEWNIETDELWWSQQTYELFGMPPEAFQPTRQAVLDRMLPGDRPRVVEQIAASLAKGVPYDAEYRIRRVDGSIQQMAGQGQVVRDAAGKPVRMVGSVQDVTNQHRQQARARRVERLAALGALAAGIAHEINNPICAAWLTVEAALAMANRSPPATAIDECLASIASSIQRCQAVVQSVLQLARQEHSAKSPSDLNQIARQSVETTRQFAQSRGTAVTLRERAQPSLANVCASEIEQVLVNVIRNAIQAGAGGVEISIEQEAAGWIGVIVRDNGRGIAPEDIGRIFDPFYSRGGAAETTGLGLAISHAIIVEHGGQIDVESEVGKGTAISVKLPLASS